MPLRVKHAAPRAAPAASTMKRLCNRVSARPVNLRPYPSLNEARTAGLMWKFALLVLALGALLIASLWGVADAFKDVQMSLNGWIALGLGVFLSLALGMGLMGLVFFSARRGYDDRIELDPPD
jgi:hypothetical protein